MRNLLEGRIDYGLYIGVCFVSPSTIYSILLEEYQQKQETYLKINTSFEKYDMVFPSKGSIVSNGWNRPADRSNSGWGFDANTKSFRSWIRWVRFVESKETWKWKEVTLEDVVSNRFFSRKDLDLVLFQPKLEMNRGGFGYMSVSAFANHLVQSDDSFLWKYRTC